MKELSFDIPIVSEANRASHEHWRVRQRRAKEQRAAFSLMWRAAKVKVEIPAVVTFTRYASRRLDSDNLPMAFKHVRDQLAAEIGIDDRDERVEWRYEQRFESGNTRGNRFTVRIEKKEN